MGWGGVKRRRAGVRGAGDGGGGGKLGGDLTSREVRPARVERQPARASPPCWPRSLELLVGAGRGKGVTVMRETMGLAVW